MDDFVLNVRQIWQYPLKTPIAGGDLLLAQEGNGGAYRSSSAATIVSSALEGGGYLRLAPGNGIAWNGAALTWQGGLFTFSEPVTAPQISSPALLLDGQLVATQVWVTQQITTAVAALDEEIEKKLDTIVEHTVWSFNGRRGDVHLFLNDVLRTGIFDSPRLNGRPTAPTPWDVRLDDNTVVTAEWVQRVICFQFEELLERQPFVFTFEGRRGNITLQTADVNAAYFWADGVRARAPTPPSFDSSTRIATTRYVTRAIEDAICELRADLEQEMGDTERGKYAPIESPHFTGIPSAPTAAPGTSSTQLATTAFVMQAVVGAVSGVSFFNGRTGNVIFHASDITGVGGALLASPQFTGTPTAPLASPGTNTSQIATTAFVHAAVSALGTGPFAPLNSPHLTGIPLAPTATTSTSTQQIATTAFVHAAIAAAGGGPGGGIPEPTTAGNFLRTNTGTWVAGLPLSGGTINSGQTIVLGRDPTSPMEAATRQYVLANAGAGGGIAEPTTAGVAFGRSGTPSPHNWVGVLPLAGGTLTGTLNFAAGPTARITGDMSSMPRANRLSVQGNTSYFTTFQVMPPPGGNTSSIVCTGENPDAGPSVLMVNSPADNRLGLQVLNYTGAPPPMTFRVGARDCLSLWDDGGVLLTRNPQAAMEAATKQYVDATAGGGGDGGDGVAGVASFNGRTGPVDLLASDITPFLSNTALSGTPTAPTASPGTSTQQIATTQFVTAAINAIPAPTGFLPLAGGTLTGTLNFAAGPTARISGDMSSVPRTNRLSVQGNTSNFTVLQVMPPPGGSFSSIGCTGENPDAGTIVQMVNSPADNRTGLQISSYTGAPPPMTFRVGARDCLSLWDDGGVLLTRNPLSAMEAATKQYVDNAVALRVPITFVIPGRPNPSQVYFVPVTMALIVPANLAGTSAYAGTAQSASATFTLTRIRSSARVTLGSVVFPSALSGAGGDLQPGDVLELAAPAAMDATLANIGISVLATRA